MLACRPKGRPASLSRAACRYVARARSTVGPHVGQQELQPLELPDRPARTARRSPAYATACARAAWAMPVRDGGDAEPAGVEGAERDPHAGALLAEPLVDRDPGAVEDHLGGDVAGQAHLPLGRAEASCPSVSAGTRNADSPRRGSSEVRAKRM